MQKNPAGSSPPLNENQFTRHQPKWLSDRGRRAAIGVAIFLLAFGVRVLTWHDTRLEVRKIQTVVVDDYQRVAELLREGGIKSFFSSSAALADLNTLGHPPGYPILIAATDSIFGRSITALQFLQIAADALATVVLFLIVAELLPLSAGAAAGMLAALSPQLAWNSVLLLPDSISVLPILLAIYLLTRAVKDPRLLIFIIIGALIGLSCWLRANAMLLTFFVAAAALVIVTKRRWRFTLAVICGTLLIVLPLTIRNAIVFHRFIPLSLGAGQTFLEGIADYDKEGRFGVPNTDVGIMKQESEIYQRPDYYGTLFNPDGVERERARLSRGFAVVRSHPLWFAGVMARRGASMLRLERSRLISPEPAVSHNLDNLAKLGVASAINPEQMVSSGTVAPGAAADLNFDGLTVVLSSNMNRYGLQFASPVISVKAANDYVVVVPVRIVDGRMRVSIENAAGTVFSSTVVEPFENTKAFDQPQQELQLPFVPFRDDEVRVIWANEASNASYSSAELGTLHLYELGPARFLWTRYPRIAIHAIQKLFLTAVMLPLAIFGLLILLLRKQKIALIVLSAAPLYFFCVQSAVHTEYRYVIAVTYFMFGFAGVAIGCGVNFLWKRLKTLVSTLLLV